MPFPGTLYIMVKHKPRAQEQTFKRHISLKVLSLEPQILNVQFGGVWLRNQSWVVAAESRRRLKKVTLI